MLKDKYPFKSFRPHSQEIMDEIEIAIAQGKKFIIVEAQTGLGKSGMAVAFARQHEGMILTATKILQDQYIDTNEFSLEYSIKGKNSYTCGLPGQSSVLIEEAVCCSDVVADDNRDVYANIIPKTALFSGKKGLAGNIKSFCASNGICPYYSKTRMIGTAPGAILNYDLFFKLKLRTTPEARGEKSYISSVSFGDSIVFDEAHQLIPKIQNNFGSSYSNKTSMRLLGQEGKRESHEQPIPWMKRVKALADSKLLVEKDPKKISQLTNFAHKLRSTLAQDLDDPQKYFIEDRGIEFDIKPLDLTGFKPLLFGSFKRVLMLSATLPPNFKQILGITDEESVIIRSPSIFDKKNRPVIFPKDVATLNYKSVITSTCDQKILLDKILEVHRNDKGIIHCANYKFFEQLQNVYRGDRRFIWVRQDLDKQTMLKFHEKSSDPTILVSPAMLEGVDLKDDLARFQILLKVPYPMLDDYTKRMNVIYPGWYEALTCTNIVQAYGRAVRTENDRAVFYILDGAFNMLLSRSKRFLSQYFLEAMQIGTKDSLVKVLHKKMSVTNGTQEASRESDS